MKPDTPKGFEIFGELRAELERSGRHTPGMTSEKTLRRQRIADRVRSFARSWLGRGFFQSGPIHYLAPEQAFSMCFVSCTHLSIPNSNPFVACQLVQAHRPSSANFVGADSDLCAHAELPPIRESRRSVPVHSCRIYFAEELFGASLVVSHDTIRMG